MLWKRIEPYLNYEISENGVVRNITTWREVKRRGEGDDVYVSLPTIDKIGDRGYMRYMHHYKIYALLNKLFPVNE